MKEKLKAITDTLLLGTIFLTSLFDASNGKGYEQNKVAFFTLLTSLTLILFCFSYQSKLKFFLTIAVEKYSLIFILILLITSFTGLDFNASLLGDPPYFQGILFYSMLFLFSMSLKYSNLKLEQTAYALVYSAFLVAIIAIKDFVLLNYFSIEVPNYAGRVASTFGQPNFYAGFLIMVLPFCFLLIKKLGKNLIIFPTIVIILGILVSKSRISLVILLFLIVSYLLYKLGKKVRIFLIFLILITSLFLIIYALKPNEILWKELGEPYFDNGIHFKTDILNFTPERRVYIWPVMLNLVSERIILGYGLENIDLAYSKYFAKIDFNSVKNQTYYSLKDLTLNRAHAYPLDLILYSGIFGLISWGVLTLKAFKKSDIYLKVTLGIFIIWSLVQIPTVSHLMIFWIAIGFTDR